jgi:methylated-DNA-[protein]-cysteine S-methyltransferase
MKPHTLSIDSPLGPMRLVHRGETLLALHFSDRWAHVREIPEATRSASRPRLLEALDAYWAGDLEALDRIEVDPGGTEFQRRVWRVMRRIPAGTTVSYSELASRVGAPGAARAVGAANAFNPIGIVIPCHRVIGADGSLHGYGGGLDRKRALLAHEGARVAALAT